MARCSQNYKNEGVVLPRYRRASALQKQALVKDTGEPPLVNVLMLASLAIMDRYRSYKSRSRHFSGSLQRTPQEAAACKSAMRRVSVPKRLADEDLYKELQDSDRSMS